MEKLSDGEQMIKSSSLTGTPIKKSTPIRTDDRRGSASQSAKKYAQSQS